VKQGREQLAPRQIAGGAEHHQKKGGDGNDAAGHGQAFRKKMRSFFREKGAKPWFM
jgi:hypothetical protein